MIARITRLSVMHTGRLLALLYSFLSVIMIPFMLIGFGRPSNGEMNILSLVLLMLVLYPVLGFVGGIIMAGLYNIAAKWVGGIEVTLESRETDQSDARYGVGDPR